MNVIISMLIIAVFNGHPVVVQDNRMSLSQCENVKAQTVADLKATGFNVLIAKCSSSDGEIIK